MPRVHRLAAPIWSLHPWNASHGSSVALTRNDGAHPRTEACAPYDPAHFARVTARTRRTAKRIRVCHRGRNGPACPHPRSRHTEMEFGATIFFTDYSISPAELGVALEERGFESLWAAEHSHIPVPRRPPPPGGRFLFGIGGGWNAEEIEAHGTVFATRMKKMREQMEAMKEIWTKSTAEYNGEIVKVPSMQTWPKPTQKPYPPILLGGAFPWAARRAIRYGDGWFPNASSGNPDDYMPRFRQMCSEAGREPLPVTLGGCPEDLAKLQRFRELGAVRANVSLPAEKADQILPILDRWAALIRQVKA